MDTLILLKDDSFLSLYKELEWIKFYLEQRLEHLQVVFCFLSSLFFSQENINGMEKALNQEHRGSEGLNSLITLTIFHQETATLLPLSYRLLSNSPALYLQ
ncbi:hypothetical protein Syun_030556 [Stephania yunnanensis]|uniref:Uncharacterized protein n=1 Tax=Stephania yunnanensis TaxID=152371 RepID=A0AAP0HAL1_9MAGN